MSSDRRQERDQYTYLARVYKQVVEKVQTGDTWLKPMVLFNGRAHDHRLVLARLGEYKASMRCEVSVRQHYSSCRMSDGWSEEELHVTKVGVAASCFSSES
jgi:hypothetical protein